MTETERQIAKRIMRDVFITLMGNSEGLTIDELADAFVELLESINTGKTKSKDKVLKALSNIVGVIVAGDSIYKAYQKFYLMGANPLFMQKKQSIIKWDKFQENKITKPEAREAYNKAKSVGASGLAIVSGVNGWRCLDIDGCNNEEFIRKTLEALGLGYDYPYTVRTGGGYHIWIQYPKPYGNKGTTVYPAKEKYKKYFKQIELREYNGYALIPPSLHPSGKKYQWLNGEPYSTPSRLDPENIVKTILKVTEEKEIKKPNPRGGELLPSKKPTSPKQDLDPFTQNRISKYFDSAVRGKALKIEQATEGQRNETLRNQATSIATMYECISNDYPQVLLVDPSSIEQYFCSSYQKVKPDAPPHEAENTFKNGWQYGRSRGDLSHWRRLIEDRIKPP